MGASGRIGRGIIDATASKRRFVRRDPPLACSKGRLALAVSPLRPLLVQGEDSLEPALIRTGAK